MKRFIIHRKERGCKPQPLEMWQFDKLPMAMRAAARLKEGAPGSEFSIYDNQTKAFLK